MKQEKRKLEMTITSCEMCPFCLEYSFIPRFYCGHDYDEFMEDINILDLDKIKEDCPLTKIEE